MKKLLTSLLFFSSLNVNANLPIDSQVSICSTYPALNNNQFIPAEFNTINNLARPKDSAFYQAQGEIVTIYGRVMDSNCIPLIDAKIYIWQANSHGYYQYKLQQSDTQQTKIWLDPNFTGTGIANTDNLGRFNFKTIIPGKIGKLTPHINFKIEHRDISDFNSKIYFSNQNKILDKNNNNQVFQINEPEQIGLVSFVKSIKPGIYLIDITLPEKQKFKQY